MPGSGDRKPSVAAGGSRRKPSQSNSNSGQTSPAIPSSTGSKSTVKHIPVNTFNSQDVNNHFQNSWTAALENFHRAGTTGAGKTEMYKGVETMAWGSKAPKKGAMSTGVDFLAELKRKEATL